MLGLELYVASTKGVKTVRYGADDVVRYNNENKGFNTNEDVNSLPRVHLVSACMLATWIET